MESGGEEVEGRVEGDTCVMAAFHRNHEMKKRLAKQRYWEEVPSDKYRAYPEVAGRTSGHNSHFLFSSCTSCSVRYKAMVSRQQGTAGHGMNSMKLVIPLLFTS